MLHEQELLDMAGTYRDMAKTALALVLRVEFNERAARYETAASMMKRHRELPAPPTSRSRPPASRDKVGSRRVSAAAAVAPIGAGDRLR